MVGPRLKTLGLSGHVIRPIFTLLLITTLIVSPLLFIRDQRVVAAARVKPSAAQPPLSAPPEPFVLPSHGITEKLPPAASEIFASLAGYFSRTKVTTAADPNQLPEPFRSTLAANVRPVAPTTLLDPPPPSSPAGVTTFDFDGDGKADISRWHSSNTEYKIRNSTTSTYSTYTIGSTSARQAPADYDGDGKTDPAFYDSGTWTIRQSGTGTTTTISGFGLSGDIPVPGNYVGGSEIDEAVFRPSNSTWYFRDGGGTHTVTSVAFGTSGDIPEPGDYDGDGLTDHAVFRPSNGTWYVQPSSGGSYYGVSWGLASDVPVPGDYDGDGKTDPAVFRPSTGVWYVRLSNTGTTTTFTWGNYADQPVPADYDGDGKTDYAIWRPTTGVWWIYKSSTSTLDAPVLGVNGDFAVPSSYVKQVGGNVETDDLAVARLSPKNAIGSTDLYSQNFSWGTGLVSLPGRAGLDLNFGISYNSLVWTKVGSAMVFDPDYSNITPGFSFGFPTIEPNYYDGAKSTYSYLMVTPSGRRIEFRQSAVSGTYDAVDSSYAQLVTSATDPNADATSLTIKVTTTDGTQMSYAWNTGAFRCTEIKDRNGNKISITNSSSGHLESITDTLGRVVTVNYNSDGFPSTITQTWKDTNGAGSDTTHTWATFTYTPTDGTGTAPAITTNFGSLAVAGPPNGTSIKVLQQITYPDGNYTKFTYNNYVQVVKVQNYAPNNDELNHVLLNDISSVSGTQSDCPRFTVVKNFAENFNGGAETTVTNTYNTVSGYSIYSGQSISGTRIDTVLTSDPDSHYSRSFYANSGWQEGLPLATEDCIGTTSDNCSTRKRWTWTNWTQDNTSLAYNLNPRVTETRVGDGMNTKRTTINYYQPTTGVFPFGLAETVKVYDTDLSTVLKTQKTTYNLSSDYTSRRIIGLPAESDLWQGTDSGGTLMSKVTYGYDEEDFSHESNQNISTVIQHDNTSYTSSFVLGRGNLTTTTRYDVTGATSPISSKIRYDIAGSVVASIDPRSRKAAIDYSDNFNDTTTTRNTFAYPTTLTDPGPFSSTVQYRFDIGANVWARSPTPSGSGNTYGKTSSRTFDDTTGRISKQKIENSGAYTRYSYGTDGTSLTTYSTIVDANGDGSINSSDEVLTETLFDGAGHVRKARTENPNSTGGYTGQVTEYDILGRVTRQTVPTEMDSSWNPAGDDYYGGSTIWRWNSQEYDWKGRVTRSIPSDSTGSDGKDTLITYEGCGCAGGQITTVKGPVTTAVDVSGTLQTTKRRTQKSYDDILGRTDKTEIWDLDGASLYSTTEVVLNGRDQTTQVTQTDNTDIHTPQKSLVTTMSYDGFGRLSSKHIPEQSTGTTTAYTYNADDSIATVTDARGAVTTFTYGHLDDSSSSEYRALPTKVHWSVPTGSSITVPSDVTYSYDSASNRTAMSDGTGSATYSYDELSRMVSETKTITGLTGSLTIGYQYALLGQLKKITDPSDAEINYAFDRTGRLTGVTGSGTLYSSVSTYASNISYRGWGALKSMNYGDSTTETLEYNNRLQPTSYSVSGIKVYNTTTAQPEGGDFTYYNDGTLKFASDDRSDASLYGLHDRAYVYDHVGRIKHAYSAAQAQDYRDGTSQPLYGAGPYVHEFTYDAFNNMTERVGMIWSEFDTGSDTYNSQNRNTAWSYDA